VRRVLLLALCAAAILASGCAFGVALPVKYVAHDRATVNGRVFSNRPAGEDVRIYFEYGKTTSYGTKFGYDHATPNPVGGGDYDLATKLTGLEPGTTYHYRLCGQDRDNEGFPGCVGDQSFTTPTTTGPYLTLTPLCQLPDGRHLDGIDITGTGFPPASLIEPGVPVSADVSVNGGPFQSHGGTRTNTDGDVNLTGLWNNTNVDVWDVRAYVDPNFNATLDPGEHVAATAQAADTCTP
jgi:hypothetical protein